MTVQSVITEVCSFVGVRPPQGSIMQPPLVDRTMWEFVNLANEMAARIAHDTRDWTMLRVVTSIPGDGVTTAWDLPSNYKRMLLTTNVWRSTNTQQPMAFISDFDEWLRRRQLPNPVSNWGEWTIYGGQIHIYPALAGTDPITAEKARFAYIDRNIVKIGTSGGGFGETFLNDVDTFRLDERLLKLGMIWQWKANKGATYAEDLANYEDALSRVAGNDKPSPILIGSRPVSSDANIAYWGPTPAGGTFVGPGP